MKPRDPGAIAGAAPAAAAADDRYASDDFSGPLVKADTCPVAQRTGAGQHVDGRVGDDRALERAGRDELLPARQIRDLQIGEIDGRALARNGLLFPAAVNLDAAHRDRPPVRCGRHDRQPVVGANACRRPGCR